MSRMYSVKKSAKMLGVTTYTLRNWAKAKKIKAVKMPDNSKISRWYIPEDEIKRMQTGGTSNEG